MFVARENWRHEAEATCINSGSVKENTGIVRVKPIQGPGMCGADYPLKVSALGDSSALGYGDELRPPGGIPNASRQPRWPIVEPDAPVAQPPYNAPTQPRTIAPAQTLPPPGGARPTYPPSSSVAAPPGYDSAPGLENPVALDPPGTAGNAGAGNEPYDFRRPYGVATPPRGAATQPPRRAPVTAAPLDQNSPAYDLSPVPYDRRRVVGEPQAPPDQEPEPSYEPPQQYDRPLVGTPRTPHPKTRRPVAVPLGPQRAPAVTGATAAVAFSPPATLACPLVSALDQWIASSVQPAAMRWFGQPVIEIKQISAYSCRGMNGNPNARISEHAFGNALDIHSFKLADGTRVTVKDGWKGAPEEQGFLRDVQGAACEQFSTVLAPGSNVYHYDHIHVDLMRRNGGRRACNPRAVSGEEIAQRARANYASRRGEPSVTGSVRRPKGVSPTSFAPEPRPSNLPAAVPGEDGED